MKDDLVVKSNFLIQQSYKLNLLEQKIILYLISHISRDDNDKGSFKKTYQIDINRFLKLKKSKHKNIFQQVKYILKELIRKPFEIVEEDGSIILTTWFSDAYFASDSSVAEISFSERLKPYLLLLKEKFTAYELKNVLYLSSSHSIRIYELLKQYETMKSFVLKIDQIKFFLGIENKYKDYSQFRRRVLEVAKKETQEHCDLTFEYEPEEKKGKKIISLKFKIIKGDKSAEKLKKQIAQANISTSDFNQNKDEFLKVSVQHGISKKVARNLIADKDIEILDRVFKKWIPLLEKGILPNNKIIDNPSGLLKWAIENEDMISEEELKKKEQKVNRLKKELGFLTSNEEEGF